ncbi:GNAT family N-acetyltransferase [Guggenheimella bovis]
MRYQHIAIEEMKKLPDVEVVYESESVTVLYDRLTEAHVIKATNEDLKELDNVPFEAELVLLTDAEITDYIKKRFNLHTELRCVQFVWTKKEAPSFTTDLTFRHPSLDELDLVSELYTTFSKEYLKENFILTPRLIAGYKDGEMVGFTGVHTDGSMGLLVIREEYRRRGYAEALVKNLITEQLKKGIVPYGHVEVSNEKSILLQKKIGFDSSPKEINWIW